MRKAFFLICFLKICCTLSAQNKVEAALNKYFERHPVEKIFIQYDNESYLAGETVRFKCYVFKGYFPTDLSTNLYVELYNQDKKLLDKSIIPLFNGVGEGGFLLPNQLAEGVYYIRAYTTWMLNFDENFPYLHSFLVYNLQSEFQLKAKPVRWAAQAFAESGQLIAGVENKISIRLFTETFLPTNWQGVIKERGDTTRVVSTFSSFNQEVASAKLVPEENKTYQATITDNFGNTRTIILPSVRSSGVLFKAKQEGDTVICKILIKGLQAKEKKYILLWQMQHKLAYKTTIGIRDSLLIVKLPTNGLENGILHLTLFDSKEQPLAERLVFVYATPKATVHIQSDTLSLASRALNSWKVAVDSTSLYSYSVMVTDVSQPVAKENLLSSLWLSNDITYRSYHPAWYFNEHNEYYKEALDALLVSERWRWFTWRNIMDGRYPNSAYQSDHYLSFTGTVFRSKRLLLNAPVNLVFSFSDSTNAFHQSYTDSSGSFQIDGALFLDSAKVFYMLNSKKYSAKTIRINFEQNNKFKKLLGSLPQSSYVLIKRNATDSLSPLISTRQLALKNQLLVESRYKKLEEVVVKAKRQSVTEQLNKRLSSSFFQSSDEIVFDFVNEKYRMLAGDDILAWVRQHVSGFAFTGYDNIPVYVYVDENLAGNFLPPASEVAMIKVFRNATGGIANGRVIAIYTRRGDGGFVLSMPHAILMGYKAPRPLMPFNYADEVFAIINEDKRGLLHWETSLPLRDGVGVIRFYNNDVTKAFRVVVTGFTITGQPVYLEQVLSAKQ
jgi:hypothetical protein